MIEIVAVILIGKYFYNLADKYEKSKWGYTVLGIISFYGTVFLCGVIYAFWFFAQAENQFATEDDMSTLLVTFISLPIGIGVAYLLYFLLERNWKKNFVSNKPSIDDIGKN